MKDFSQEIDNFQRYGTYTYNFDSVGNLIFNSSSLSFNQVYIAFSLENTIYNKNKIKTMYDVNFNEFIPASITDSNNSTQSINDVQQQLNLVQQQNIILKSQLDTVISKNEVSGSSAANQMAIKQVIIELRTALGQGYVTSDFSTEFPYTPILKVTT